MFLGIFKRVKTETLPGEWGKELAMTCNLVKPQMDEFLQKDENPVALIEKMSGADGYVISVGGIQMHPVTGRDYIASPSNGFPPNCRCFETYKPGMFLSHFITRPKWAQPEKR